MPAMPVVSGARRLATSRHTNRYVVDGWTPVAGTNLSH